MIRADFISRYGGVFEHSPFIAERAFDAGAISEPFSASGVHAALTENFRAASPEERLGVLRAHPDLFILSVLMGLAAYCTGSLALGMALHFAYNTMSFLFLYAAQKMDGVSAFAFAGYLVAVFCVGAVVCLAAIRRLGVMRRFRPIPRVYDPKNRQSRLERLASAPLFPLVMACMALRAAWPLFAK